jgi:Tol biopolymer transport system component
MTANMTLNSGSMQNFQSLSLHYPSESLQESNKCTQPRKDPLPADESDWRKGKSHSCGQPLYPLNPLTPAHGFSYIRRMETRKTLLISAFVAICILLVLIVRLSLFEFTPRISPDSTTQECLELAQTYIESGKPESAFYPLLLAVEKDEGNFRAHSLLARAYYQTGVNHLAEEECDRALELSPQDRDVLELLCRIKFEEGRSSWRNENLQQAIADFRFVAAKTDDQRLLDSVAQITGGRLKKVRLTNDLFTDDAPSFSPDGERIVYHSDTSYYLEDYGLEKIEVKRSRLFVMDADGQNKRRLSPQDQDETSERFGRFSHDGRFIVYEKENSQPGQTDTAFNSDRDIFVRDLDAGTERRLTHDHDFDALPSFSPDDAEIIFVSDRPGGKSSIYRLNLKSGEREDISLKELWDEKIGLLRHSRGMILPYCPSFSPDGRSVLLHSGWDVRGVYVLNLDDLSWRRVTKRGEDSFFPSFSSEGKRIVFVSGYRDEEEDLYVVDADGSNLTRLTQDGGTKRYPSFSPDGNSIVFGGKRKGEPDYYFEIYLLQLDQTISREKLTERLEELEKAGLESLTNSPR